MTAAGVVTGSTATALPNYGTGPRGAECVRADGRDVVYQVAIPAATRLAVTATPLTSFDLAVNLVADATACGTPAAAMQCFDGSDTAGAGRAEQLSFSNAGSARTVLIIVDGYAGNDFGSFALSIAFTPIATGDACNAPVTLTPGTPLLNQTMVGFANDYSSSSSGRCEFKSDVDRVYGVQVPAGQRLVATVTPTGFDPSLSLVQGAMNCGLAVCLSGTDDGLTGGLERLQWDNLSATAQQVLLVVDTYNATANGSFTIGATLSASPPAVTGGSTCGAPIALDAGTFVSTTAGRASQFDFFGSAGCEATTPAPDTVFSVTVPPSSLVRATVTPDGWDAVLNVLASAAACGMTTDAGTLGATCLTSSDGPRTASVEEVTIRNATATATTALLVVDGHDLQHSGAFTITTEIVPLAALPGDTCQAPQPLLMSGSLTGLTTVGYFDDVETASSCSTFQNRGADRVFSITVPAGKQLTAVVIPNGWDAAIILLDAMTCGMNATCFESSDSSISGAETARFTNTAMADRTVFIVVDAYSSSASGTFDLFTAITP